MQQTDQRLSPTAVRSAFAHQAARDAQRAPAGPPPRRPRPTREEDRRALWQARLAAYTRGGRDRASGSPGAL
jgi:hypothetical protein